jgi:hypothetical protein
MHPHPALSPRRCRRSRCIARGEGSRVRGACVKFV